MLGYGEAPAKQKKMKKYIRLRNKRKEEKSFLLSKFSEGKLSIRNIFTQNNFIWLKTHREKGVQEHP